MYYSKNSYFFAQMDTLFVGQTLIHLYQTDSTNNHALQMLSEGNIAEGTVIYTDKQTSGKGQRGNSWLTEPLKDVALSVVLKPSFLAVDKQFMLNKAVSLAFRGCMAQRLNGIKADNTVTIKWPNDIFVNDKKIGGILIENLISGNSIKHSVVGIGININSEPTLPTSTSLKEIGKQDIPLSEILTELCGFMEQYYLLLKSDPNRLNEEYLKHLYRIHEPSDFLISDKKIKGKIMGVNESGKLIVNLNNEIRSFDLKEIQFIY